MSRPRVSQRCQVALLAVAVAIPVNACTCAYVLVRNLGTDSISRPRIPALVVWLAIFASGSLWVGEVISRITGGKVDGHTFSIPFIAVGTIGGVLAGTIYFDNDPIVGGLGLAFLGGLLGSFVPLEGLRQWKRRRAE
jgi:hypothetical protein